MFDKKNKIVFLIFTIFIFSFITPFYSFASDISFVWSQMSSPTVQTVASLNQDKRQFFKFNLWKCYFN